MKLLLTGFEPFGGSSVNPSIQVVRVLANGPMEGVHLQTAMLPVDKVSGPATLVMAVESYKPDVVICLGQATGRAVISIERVAVNLLDYAIPDNSGAQVKDEPIVPDGPAAYFTSIAVREIRDAVQAAGVPAELSLSAGAFLCNQVLYTLLHHISVNKLPIKAGFIHMPALPEQVIDRPASVPSMSMETMVRGVRAAINTHNLRGL
jgi:pyroglutamyl-peptidase